MQWIALSKTDHAQSLYFPRDSYLFASDEQAVPVLLAELGKLLPHFVIGFTKEGGHYQPVAITGLGQGNLYLHPQGKWLGSYVPAVLRGYPFRLADNEQGEKVLCIDQQQLTDEPSAQPVFTEDGQLAPKVAQTLNFLKQCEQNRQVTQACVHKLDDAGVIEEWPLEIGRSEGKNPLKVNGIFRISEQALNNLDAETLHGLRGGPLSLAYAQMFSTAQHKTLADRVQFQAKYAEQGNSAVGPMSLDELFEEGDDDFIFDFGD